MAGLLTFQSGPKGTKMVNPSVLTIWDPFWPSWTLLGPPGPFWAHLDPFGPCLATFGPKWTISIPELWTPKQIKTNHQVSYMWPACRIPKFPVWNIKMASNYAKCYLNISQLPNQTITYLSLYFNIPRTEKYSIVMCYLNITKLRLERLSTNDELQIIV